MRRAYILIIASLLYAQPAFSQIQLHRQYDLDFEDCYEIAEQNAINNAGRWQAIYEGCMISRGHEGDNDHLTKY